MSVQSLPAYFFTPQHIILVGASERPHSLGERILTALLNAPFQGKITPVNPRHKTIAGLTSYTNVARLEETADLVITVTPPETYESLFKACRKKQLHHVIIIQDWDNLPPEAWETAAAAIKKHHGEKLNISVCNPAGAQIPTQGLNAGILPDYPAGHVAVLTGQASLSSEINVLLRKMKQGVSRHISLNYDLSPTTSADWLNRFGHKRHTRAAVIHFNPRENHGLERRSRVSPATPQSSCIAPTTPTPSNAPSSTVWAVTATSSPPSTAANSKPHCTRTFPHYSPPPPSTCCPTRPSHGYRKKPFNRESHW